MSVRIHDLSTITEPSSYDLDEIVHENVHIPDELVAEEIDIFEDAPENLTLHQNIELDFGPSITVVDEAAGLFKNSTHGVFTLENIENAAPNAIDALPLHEKRQSRPPMRFNASKATTDLIDIKGYKVSKIVAFVDNCYITKEQFDKLPDRDKWFKAMEDELSSQKRRFTYEKVDFKHVNGSILPCRWVLNRKKNTDGSVRFKARLVIGGHKQQEGIDYKETFASTLKMESLRFILAIATINGWDVHQGDFVTAFLNASLDEELFMGPIPLFDSVDTIYKLTRALYGLKQAPRAWQEKLVDLMGKLGYNPIISDSCIFTNKKTWIAVFVDDMTITGPDLDEIKKIKHDIAREYEFKDLGELRHILGLKWTRNKETKESWLCQDDYINTILERFGMENSQPVTTPAVALRNPEDSKLFANPQVYMEAVGSLIYLATCTRPDITYAVSMVARHMKEPSVQDWIAVKRIFRYLQGTRKLGLYFNGNLGGNCNINAYSDADWAGDAFSQRRSRTGYAIYLGGCLISWYSKLLPGLNAMSTVEAEYKGAYLATQEVLWMLNLAQELNYKIGIPILHVDNQGAIASAKNPTHHGKLKHIDLKYHFLRQCISSGVLTIEYCPTGSMPADIFTKALFEPLFVKHCSALGVQECP